MPGDAPWAYINAKKAKQKAEAETAALQARIQRLEAQLIDLGHDPAP